MDATYITGQNLDLTVQLNEPVTIVTTGGTPYIAVSLATGGTVNAIYQSGSGTSSLVFRYTIANGNYDADGISVGSAINANGGTLKDAAGNDAILTLNSVANTAGVKVDAIAPAVTSVEVPADGTYIVGDNLEFKVNFDDIVTVITTGGTPYIPVTLSTGGTVNATYISGSGTNAITFRYTLVSGNADSDGVEVGTSISTNGGTLKDAAGNNATLVLNNVATATGVLVDAIAPAVATVQVPANGTYNTGKNLDFTVNYNDPVTVNVSGGTPYLPVTLNTGGTVNAVYQEGSGTSELLFRYTIVAGNEDADGVSVGAGITSNGGTLKDVAGNHAALALNGVGNTAGVLVDAIVPEVSSVTVPANATYISGQDLDFIVTFNEAVTLDNTSGTPYITLTIGSGNTANAVYVSGSGTSAIVFRYTIIAGMADNDGIAVGNSITTNGAKLTDAAGNDVVLTLNGVGNTSGVKVDAIAPDVSLATTENSPTKVSSIPVTITFTEEVTGFTVGDISVVNGTLANFSGTGSGYSVDLLPSAQGNVSISIVTGVAQDATGNDNTASNTITLIYDSQAPTATISTTASDPTNSTSLPVQITFNEDVTGFTMDDIVVSNASKSNFTGSGSQYGLQFNSFRT
ncbi:MAG: hypothetical protein HC896_17570, partial [Bacteroidales bacterium]|nr:hypothetical protein [Bacteroidales bacterium]